VLETNDLFYGDLSTVKEVESLLIQATLGTAIGVEVYVSARENLGDDITFKLVGQVWTPSLREGRLSLPRVAGRIIRYRFVPKPNAPASSIDSFKWTNFTEFAYNVKPEK
jgi:hypothetical protein